MVRTVMARGVAAAALAVALALAASPSAYASATALVLPQSAAFSILGHSCGGIQEKTYATGFDAASGYPTGAVFLSTRCGGSGRGGGYHTTTYSATATVSWDFTATVISYAASSTAPVDPNLAEFDANGNEVFNQSGSAFLVLAPDFVPAPRVTSVSPSAGPAAGGTTVTIAGTGFSDVTGVSFGGTTAASFTVNSSTSITATSPAAAAGSADVTVSNAGGASAPTAGDLFTFVAAPIVSAVSPNVGPVGGGTTVTITGANFTDATRVAFGGAAAGFTVNDDTSITAVAPPAEAAEAVSLTVTSLGGRSARTAAARFTYVALRPAVTSIDPSVGPEAGGTFVTITGANLGGATRVSFGGVAAEFAVYDDATVVALSPAGTGTVDVTITTLGGTSAVAAGDEFTFVAGPSVSSVTPGSGSVDGGTEVTITGAGFAGATEVDFGGVPADFVVNDDSSITAIAPPADAGTVDVTVITDMGTSATGAEDQFTYG